MKFVSSQRPLNAVRNQVMIAYVCGRNLEKSCSSCHKNATDSPNYADPSQAEPRGFILSRNP